MTAEEFAEIKAQVYDVHHSRRLTRLQAIALVEEIDRLQHELNVRIDRDNLAQQRGHFD